MDKNTQVQETHLSPMQHDAALLILVHEGDEQAMASLFDRYSRIVYSVALRVLRDPRSCRGRVAGGLPTVVAQPGWLHGNTR